MTQLVVSPNIQYPETQRRGKERSLIYVGVSSENNLMGLSRNERTQNGIERSEPEVRHGWPVQN